MAVTKNHQTTGKLFLWMIILTTLVEAKTQVVYYPVHPDHKGIRGRSVISQMWGTVKKFVWMV